MFASLMAAPFVPSASAARVCVDYLDEWDQHPYEPLAYLAERVMEQNQRPCVSADLGGCPFGYTACVCVGYQDRREDTTYSGMYTCEGIGAEKLR